MILTDLKNAESRLPEGAAFRLALDFLRRPDIQALPDGKYEIDGEKVFAMVQRYETLEEAEPKFEAHRKYIDLQFLASGAEIIGWAPLKEMLVTEVYDGGKDACFGVLPAGGWKPLRLGAGRLAVLGPEDAHAPRLAAGAPAPVLKVVVKVAARPLPCCLLP
ncbi:MAG: YhcH/YjgK/YiaL family protein [Elusimicrobiota bacterium]|nr:YhcH/YjgK/YiaL family protein [Elusimicrobiota bacterium]